MYEAFYSYPINDGMTVTPVVYIKDIEAEDQTGFMVKHHLPSKFINLI